MAEEQGMQRPTEQDPAVLPPGPLASEAVGGRPGFLSTPSGKLIVAGVAVAALLVIGGAVAVFLFLFNARQAAVRVVSTVVSQSPTSPPASQPSTKTPATEATQPAQPPVPVNFESVFTFRNPFKPLIAPEPSVASTSTTSSAETSTTTKSEQNVLTLQDIVVDNGVRKAILVFDGVTYTAGAGENLGSTPWKVLSVGDSSVTMLFGDQQVVLSVGEGIQK